VATRSPRVVARLGRAAAARSSGSRTSWTPSSVLPEPAAPVRVPGPLWAQRHDGAHRARRVVTLGAPHHGTKLAAAGILLAPGACPKACQQLAPGSPLLRSLTTPVPSPPRWLAVWTDQDQTVTPPDSGHLEGAVNVAVQALCPQRPVSHSQLPTDGAVTSVVLQAIGADPLVAPDPAACAG
jgi:triacylglycerol lipase